MLSPAAIVGVEGATIGRQTSASGEFSTYTPTAAELPAPIPLDSIVGDAVVAALIPGVAPFAITTAGAGGTNIWTTSASYSLAPGDTFEYNGAGGGCLPIAPASPSTHVVLAVTSATSFTTAGGTLDCSATPHTAVAGDAVHHGALVTTTGAPHALNAGQQICFDGLSAAVTVPAAPPLPPAGVFGPTQGGGDAGVDCLPVSIVINATAWHMLGIVVTTAAAAAAPAMAFGLDLIGSITVTTSGPCGNGALSGGPIVVLPKIATDGVTGTYAPAMFFSQDANGTCEIDTIGVLNGTGATNGQIQLVGAPALISLADPHATFGRATQGGPPIGGAPSANKSGGTVLLNTVSGTTQVGREFMVYAVDSANQPTLLTTGITFAVAPAGLFANTLATFPTTTLDANATTGAPCPPPPGPHPGCYFTLSPGGARVSSFGPPAAGTPIPPGNYGFAHALVTAASLDTENTFTLTVTGGIAAPLLIVFTTALPSTITWIPPAQPGAGDPFLSCNQAGTNICGLWRIQVDGANGIGVPGLAADGALTVTNNAANPEALIFGPGNNGGLAQAPDLAPLPLGPVLDVPGQYAVFIGPSLLTGPGNYLADANVFLGGVALPLVESHEIICSGPADSSSVTVSDVLLGTTGLSSAGAALSEIGPNESIQVTFTFLDANDNPVPGATPVLIGATAGIILPPPPYATTNGMLTITYAAPAFSGQQTITAQSGTVVEQLEVEVGGTGGGNPDAISVIGTAARGTDPGDPIGLSFLVERNGAPVDDALVSFDATCGETSPDETQTGVDGLAATTFQSNELGTCIVGAQVFTLGLGGQPIPIKGLQTSITIHVGGAILDLTQGGQFVRATFSGNAAGAFGAQATIA